MERRGEWRDREESGGTERRDREVGIHHNILRHNMSAE